MAVAQEISMENWRNYYNNKRLHESLKNETLIEFRNKFYNFECINVYLHTTMPHDFGTSILYEQSNFKMQDNFYMNHFGISQADIQRIDFDTMRVKTNHTKVNVV